MSRTSRDDTDRSFSHLSVRKALTCRLSVNATDNATIMITRSVSARETLTRWPWAHKEEGTDGETGRETVGEIDIVPDEENP